VSGTAPTAAVVAQNGFFLRDLFSKVIFADRNLVQQYTSRNKLRWRYAAFFSGALLLGAALAGWTWSYVGNRQLVANVQADLAKAIKLQEGRIDLQSRLEALEIVQDRVEQLQHYREERPWSLTLGLYQGAAVEEKLRAEYLAGLQEVMLKPTAAAIATYLSEGERQRGEPATLGARGRRHAGQAQRGAGAGRTAGCVRRSSTSNVPDAYNALQDLHHAGRPEPNRDRPPRRPAHAFLARLARGNRGSMPRETTDPIGRTHHVVCADAGECAGLSGHPKPTWRCSTPTRENLRRVVKGMPARERVYAEIKARAATRFPPVTVARLVDDADKDVVAGSYAISGAFTREAWQQFVDDAFKEAATKETKGRRLGAQDRHAGRPDAGGQPGGKSQGAGAALQDRVRGRMAEVHARRQRQGVRQFRAGRGAHEPARRPERVAGRQTGSGLVRADLVGQPGPAE